MKVNKSKMSFLELLNFLNEVYNRICVKNLEKEEL